MSVSRSDAFCIGCGKPRAMSEYKVNVVSTTVAQGLCIGCGVCAGVCPRQNLVMDWNVFGTYEPLDRNKCSSGCGLCLRICPFQDHEENENTIACRLFGNQPEILYNSQLGYYLKSWVGYVECGDYRLAGASGGVATWFLDKLLSSGYVDRIICVTPTNDPNRLFQFECFDSSEGIRHSSKSAYYPVEMSAVVKEIIRTKSRYACIGLPCFLKALRLAEQQVLSLNERIIIHAGLVCGQLKSRYFAEILARRAGLNAESVNSVSFREKNHNSSAAELIFEASDRYKTGRLAWSEGYGDVWTTGQLKIRACGFCDDVFAETADVVFMDAWLPKYIQDGRGTNIVVARSETAVCILDEGIKSGELNIYPISASEVVASQADVIYEKRYALARRLWLADLAGQSSPKKRVSSSKPNLIHLWLLRTQEAVRLASYEAIIAQRAASAVGCEIYDKAMVRPLRKLKVLLVLTKVGGKVLGLLRAARRLKLNAKIYSLVIEDSK